MSKYLIKTMRLDDNVTNMDMIRETDWRYVDSDKIDTLNIFGKQFVEATVAPPIKHGKWIRGEWLGTIYCCSLCQFQARKKYPYCVCGAKMDEEISEATIVDGCGWVD